MQIIRLVTDIFFHLDENLVMVLTRYGNLTYGLLFLIIFMETGFVVTPFLPGDSLLFATGALAATSSLNIYYLIFLLISGAFLGDTVNYWIGHFVGPKVFNQDTKLFKKEYLLKAQKFYEKHGGKAIFLARFVPIVRTFAPFVAGVGKMHYGSFLLYNLTGGITWVLIFLILGYFFGNIPFIKDNFHYAVLLIIVISLVPIFIEWKKAREETLKSAKT